MSEIWPLDVKRKLDAQAREAVRTAGTSKDPGDPALDLALRIDDAVKRVRPDGWGVCRHVSR